MRWPEPTGPAGIPSAGQTLSPPRPCLTLEPPMTRTVTIFFDTTVRDNLCAHAAACRDALAAGLPRPAWTGGSLWGADLSDTDLRDADLSTAVIRWADLRGADLRGADLRGAGLWGADLRGADLQGAVVAEGAVVSSVAGDDGGYRWHALLLAEGEVMLHYGCDRATLKEWRTRGPEYGARYTRPPEHWATGPAIAIAAAERLAAGGAP